MSPRRNGLKSRLGRWTIAIGFSLAINGLLLAGLAWREADRRYAAFPTLEITLLRPPRDRLPPTTEPTPRDLAPSPAPRSPAVAAPVSTVQAATGAGPSTPVTAGPAPAVAGADPAPPRALNLGCLGRSQASMTPEERARCQRQLADLTAGGEPISDRPALSPGAARQFGQVEADKDAWLRYQECEMRIQGNLEKEALSCAEMYPGLRSLFRRVFGQ